MTPESGVGDPLTSAAQLGPFLCVCPLDVSGSASPTHWELPQAGAWLIDCFPVLPVSVQSWASTGTR